jgi:hypothetical protein
MLRPPRTFGVDFLGSKCRHSVPFRGQSAGVCEQVDQFRPMPFGRLEDRKRAVVSPDDSSPAPSTTARSWRRSSAHIATGVAQNPELNAWGFRRIADSFP